MNELYAVDNVFAFLLSITLSSFHSILKTHLFHRLSSIMVGLNLALVFVLF